MSVMRRIGMLVLHGVAFCIGRVLVTEYGLRLRLEQGGYLLWEG